MSIPPIHLKIDADNSGGVAAVTDLKTQLLGVGKAAGVAAAAFAAFAGAAAAIKAVTSEAMKFETSMLKIDAVIKATGGAAGKTSQDLRGFARNLALTTLESTEGILLAQQKLLTFRKVSGEVFDRTIKAAADMAAAMGSDLQGAVLQLGKAMENPVTGMSALTESGTVFTDQQKEMVEALVDSGKIVEAQTFILSELEAQYKGVAAAAAGGLAGAIDTLGQRWQEFKLALDDAFGLTELMTFANNTLAEAVRYLTAGIEWLGDKLGVLWRVGSAVAGLFGDGLLRVLDAVGLSASKLSATFGLLWDVVANSALGRLVSGMWSALDTTDKLITATGSLGSVFGLLGDIGVEVWRRIGVAGQGLWLVLNGVALAIQGAFLSAFSVIGQGWDTLTAGMAAVWNSIAESGLGQGLGMSSIAGSSLGADMLSAGKQDTADGVASIKAGGGKFKEASAPLESVQKIKDLLQSIRDEELTVPDLLGVGGGEGGEGGVGGGGGKTASDKIEEGLTAQEERIKEHFDRIKALTEGSLSDKLGAWGNYFSNLVSLTGTSNQKLLAVGKAFSAGQALIDAWGAYAKVLNSPEPMPWYARLAAAGNVFAAGIGAYNAIKGVSSSGGGASASRGGGSGAGGGSSSAAASQGPLDVRLIGVGENSTLTRGQLEQIFDDLERVSTGRGLGRITFA